jgi:hypothetical protein
VAPHTLKLHWDEPEDVMNRLMTAAVIAGGLMLAHSPEAAAHKEVRHVYQPPAYTYVEVRLDSHMPRRLKHDKGFRHWYRYTPLRHDRRIAWGALFEIYKWERRRGRAYHRSDNHWNDYYAYRYGERHYDRDHGRDRRHRH